MNGLKNLILLGATILAPAAAQAEPIYVQPGQCIIVGAQQVCAQVQPCASATTEAEPKTVYTCIYAKHQGSDVPDLKSYALMQTLMGPKRKTEMLIKNYGPNGKDDCEKEAERLRATQPTK